MYPIFLQIYSIRYRTVSLKRQTVSHMVKNQKMTPNKKVIILFLMAYFVLNLSLFNLWWAPLLREIRNVNGSYDIYLLKIYIISAKFFFFIIPRDNFCYCRQVLCFSFSTHKTGNNAISYLLRKLEKIFVLSASQPLWGYSIFVMESR